MAKSHRRKLLVLQLLPNIVLVLLLEEHTDKVGLGGHDLAHEALVVYLLPPLFLLRFLKLILAVFFHSQLR